MQSLFDLSVNTLRTSDNNNNNTSQGSLAELKSFLNSLTSKQEEIRLFVAGSVNYGHQSTSVVIMNNLIRLGARFIRIVYQSNYNDPKVDPTPTSTKLTKLIPGLTQEDIDKGIFETQDETTKETVKIFFSPYTDESKNAPIVTLGISGGFDGTWNMTKALAAKCLLVLQPFRYEKYNALNVLYIKNKGILLPLGFLEKGFYIQDPVRPASYLDTPQNDTSEEWKRQTLNSVISLMFDFNSIELCPIYFSEGRSSSQPSTVLFNLLTGFLAAKGSINKKPIVLLVMSDFSVSAYKVLYFIIAGPSFWGVSTDEDVLAIQKWSPLLDKVENYTYINNLGYFDRLKKVRVVSTKQKILWPSTTVQDAVAEVGNGGIVIVDLGRLPKPVFEYVYSIGTLPGVFEGEATASLMVNIGKPYFNLESNDPKAKNQDHQLYPYPVIPSEKLYPNEISQYLSTFHQHFLDKDWEDKNKKPDLAIAEFIKLAYTMNDYVQIYFKSLRTFFHDEKEDKLLKALFFALPEMKSSGIIPK